MGATNITLMKCPKCKALWEMNDVKIIFDVCIYCGTFGQPICYRIILPKFMFDYKVMNFLMNGTVK